MENNYKRHFPPRLHQSYWFRSGGGRLRPGNAPFIPTPLLKWSTGREIPRKGRASSLSFRWLCQDSFPLFLFSTFSFPLICVTWPKMKMESGRDSCGILYGLITGVSPGLCSSLLMDGFAQMDVRGRGKNQVKLMDCFGF
ncbi:hypothetical protein TNCT_540551 [Trichonephila clavata]|uniref:Uncharacterized protein n=1 Tax=Trichonephila clavata TaxID=2740835 RepID=A0A8X6HHH8_TRICU|nr:hypothetical protein TNCT_540551 [Trichonephila clavata]